MRHLKPQSDSGAFEALDDMNTVVRLAGLMGIGIQDGYEKGDPSKDEFLATLETPNEVGPDGRPYHITKRLTISFHEKANLRGMIEALNGKKLPEDKIKFTGDPEHDEKVAEFLTKVLKDSIGKACMGTVEKYQGQNGYDKNKIQGFSALPKGMNAPELKTEYGYFDLESPDWSVFEKFPEWQRKVCNRESYAAVNDCYQEDDSIPFEGEAGVSESDEADW